MTYYIVTVSMPGYLPEADPTVIEDERAPTAVLEYIRDEIEWAMPDYDDPKTDAWDAIYAEVTGDLERAAELDPEGGFRYDMPDGYAIIAEAHTHEQLIELGYKPGEDF